MMLICAAARAPSRLLAGAAPAVGGRQRLLQDGACDCAVDEVRAKGARDLGESLFGIAPGVVRRLTLIPRSVLDQARSGHRQRSGRWRKLAAGGGFP